MSGRCLHVERVLRLTVQRLAGNECIKPSVVSPPCCQGLVVVHLPNANTYNKYLRTSIVQVLRLSSTHVAAPLSSQP
jgi:hypothetical protein